MHTKKILYSGGGTLGPVTPLLALDEYIKEVHADFESIWLGTETGPEKIIVEQKNITFFKIKSGKFRRYLSPLNIIDIYNIIVGFFDAFQILTKQKPDICITAGGYVSVPVHIAAWFLGIPTWVHQQDVDPGLANKIMAKFATKITVSLKSSLQYFDNSKTIWIGNPVRKDILDISKKEGQDHFNFGDYKHVIFAMGGGTGSQRVNELLLESLEHLDKNATAVIHLLGGRSKEQSNRAKQHASNYFPFEFFSNEMKYAYAISDLVISRGGFGTLTELAALKKPAIVIPKPGHQVNNVKFLEQADSIISLDQNITNGHILAKHIKEIISNKEFADSLGNNLYKQMPLASKQSLIAIVHELLFIGS